MSDRIRNLQTWLNRHGAHLAVDGSWGPASRSAVIEVFRNKNAPAATPDEINAIADKYGLDRRAMRAVAKVESGGSGWDDSGLLKCLWERHYLWRRVRVAVPFLSNPAGGGYTIDADRDGINDSWEKLADASGRFGFSVAAECASFGKFQVMGAHWKVLGYQSVNEMIWLLSRTELAHYEVFARFIKANNLTRALNQVDGDWRNATPIARGYNGKGQKGYDTRIAAAWRTMG